MKLGAFGRGAPLKSAHLTELTREQVRSLARCEALQRIDELELEFGGPADDALAELPASPHLARLTHLTIFGQIGPESARVIARHPKLTALESLRIEDVLPSRGPPSAQKVPPSWPRLLSPPP